MGRIIKAPTSIHSDPTSYSSSRPKLTWSHRPQVQAASRSRNLVWVGRKLQLASLAYITQVKNLSEWVFETIIIVLNNLWLLRTTIRLIRLQSAFQWILIAIGITKYLTIDDNYSHGIKWINSDLLSSEEFQKNVQNKVELLRIKFFAFKMSSDESFSIN